MNSCRNRDAWLGTVYSSSTSSTRGARSRLTASDWLGVTEVPVVVAVSFEDGSDDPAAGAAAGSAAGFAAFFEDFFPAASGAFEAFFFFFCKFEGQISHHNR